MRYDYECASCQHVFETIHGMNDSPVILCVLCNSLCNKTFLTAVPVTFKGGGWDVPEYKKIDRCNGKPRDYSRARNRIKEKNEANNEQ